MKKDNNIQEELQNISPLLTQMKDEKEGYKVPHLYFETLQDKVLAEAKKQPEKINIFARFSKARFTLISACTILILLAGVFLLKNENQTEVVNLEQISTETLALYVDENIDDFDIDLSVEIDAPTLDISDGIHLDPNELENYIEEEFIELTY